MENQVTRLELTYRYRAKIAQAIAEYGRTLRVIHRAWGCPIPPSQDCMSAMGNAWGTCRVAFKLADLELEGRYHD